MTDPLTSRRCIDSIMTKLKSQSFHQLILVSEYGRISTDFYNHLEIMERCLNGVCDSSVMLIINKVPNRVQQKRALNETPNFDLASNLKRIRDEMARIFKFEFSADFSFLNEMSDDDERDNNLTLDQIRKVLSLSESYEFTNTKTWSDLTRHIEESSADNRGQLNVNEQLKRDLKDRIGKIASNVYYAEMKVELMDVGKKVVTGVEVAAQFSKLKFLVPLIESRNESLSDWIEARKREVTAMKEEMERSEARLVALDVDSVKLNEEIEKYRKEILRLQRLLRET